MSMERLAWTKCMREQDMLYNLLPDACFSTAAYSSYVQGTLLSILKVALEIPVHAHMWS